ncbi:Bestrophin [Paragonimus heterotremus]|uniref:Bestrophin homolog n=1 Tax=Paragonimus heterotremus TaxID=100268 RepID=A0A8J4X247_9TREM|nr:Bestrophin [Paragonimus heterotremus]
MTVPYSSLVATVTYSTFLRLLFAWKGSVYRLIWFELVVFVVLYSILSVTYRFLMAGIIKTYFELACIYCNTYNQIIPVPFVLGFYVALVVGRWWEQFQVLPWPDDLALQLTAYCHGNGERPTRIRRTVMRYVNLSYCLVLRAISSRARLRFPTEEHLISSGLMTQEEFNVYKTTPPIEYSLYFAPLVWAMDIITQARREGHIRFDRATATIVVYTYFISCLFAWQYLDPSKGYAGYEVDIYVPIFGLLRFFFYMGWLKVAESLINPFGEDVDDFEIEYLIERNLSVSYLIVDEMHHDHPELVRDAFWGTTDVLLPDWTKTTVGGMDESTPHVHTSEDGDRFIGSLANLDLAGSRKMSGTFWRSSNWSKPFTSVTSLR